ncbi:hypothetical protein PLANTIT3_60942 [Plantibacter sp. T3]|nr:hypothetical protein PLANTIT3_60942 [Plantibacter sp. T3]
MARAVHPRAERAGDGVSLVGGVAARHRAMPHRGHARDRLVAPPTTHGLVQAVGMP